MGKAKREWRPGPVVIERDLYQSRAWRSLRSGTSYVVLATFWMKRQIKPDGKGGHRFINNGELVYTYAEAKEQGITNPAFTRALDDLIEHGFLDIERTGAGQHQVVTLYRLSERWRKFGTPDFEAKKRPVRRHWLIGAGFRPKAQEAV